MGDLQLVKDDVEDFNVKTVGLTLVVSELIGRKLPVIVLQQAVGQSCSAGM